MATLSTLITLVKTLTKGEKKYFAMKSNHNQGEKDYMFLFRLIDEPTPEAELKNLFLRKRPGAAFETAAKYLFSSLTDALLEMRFEQDDVAGMLTGIMKARILFEKALHNEGFTLLAKIRKKAHLLELPAIKMLCVKFELEYYSLLNFHDLSEDSLINLHMIMQQTVHELKSVHQSNSLYEQLRYRYHEQGNARKAADKEKLNDLVMSEMLITARPAANSFESKKLHLLFQSNYFMAVSDYASALQVFDELNDLFEQHKNLWHSQPADYIVMIEGVLDSLKVMQNFPKTQFYIDRLKVIKPASTAQAVYIQRITFTISCARLIFEADLTGAKKLLEDFETPLFRRMQSLPVIQQSDVNLYRTLIYISNGMLKQALALLNQLLALPKSDMNAERNRLVKLLRMLVQHKMKKIDLLEYEIRSVKRYIKYKNTDGQRLEKLLIRYLESTSFPTKLKEKDLMMAAYRNAVQRDQKSSYELNLMSYFDFESWLEAEIYSKDFSELLRSKTLK